MTRVPAVPSTPQQAPGESNDLRNVDLDDFLGLLIAELQNQDPLNPMDNSEILQQISQIREIGATNQLSETLAAVLSGQNLATASNLIGQQVRALADDGQNVEGIVDRVSIEVSGEEDGNRFLKVHVGSQSIDLKNIREIIAGDKDGDLTSDTLQQLADLVGADGTSPPSGESSPPVPAELPSVASVAVRRESGRPALSTSQRLNR